MGALTAHPNLNAPRLWAFRYTLPAADLAKHDTVVLDGDPGRLSRLASTKALNPKVVALIQPSRRLPNGTYGTSILAATYGGFDNYTASNGYSLPVTADAVVGSTRGYEAKDKMGTAEDGTTPWIYSGTGSVYVLDMRDDRASGASTDTWEWGARWTAIEARRAVALQPNVIDGVYQDNLFTSNDGYATPSWFDGDNGLRGDFDTGMARRALLLQGWCSAANLAALGHTSGGLVFGGTGGPRQYWADPATRYRGLTTGGLSWSNYDVSMLEHVNISSASSLDGTVEGITRFLDRKSVDGRQKHVVINLNSTSSAEEARFYLAVGCVSGSGTDFGDFWWYTGNSGAFGTLVLPGSATAIPEMGQKSGYARNWLGQALASGQKVAAGRWRRTFEHGTVYVNQSGTTWTPVSGVSVGNHRAVFVREENGEAPPPPDPDPPPTGGTQTGNVTTFTSTAASTSHSWTHNVAAGDDRVLYVGVGCSVDGNAVSALLVNGQAATKIDDEGSTIRHLSVWRIVLGDSATAQSATIQATLSSSSHVAGVSIDRAGVDQTAPTGTSLSAAVNSNAGTLSPASGEGDTVISFVVHRYVSGSARVITWTVADEAGAVTQGDSSSNIGISLATASAAASPASTTEMAWTSNRSDIARQVAFAENPAGEAVVQPITVLRIENVGSDSVTLGWEPETSVVVRRRTGVNPSGPSDGTLIFDDTGTGVTDTGLLPGLSYRYAVFAEDGGDFSSPAYIEVVLEQIVAPPTLTTFTRPRIRMVIPRL